MIDVETETQCYVRYQKATEVMDMSALPTFIGGRIPKDVSNARVSVEFGTGKDGDSDAANAIKTTWRKNPTKVTMVTHNGYQFYRYGSVLRVLASKDIIDADQGIDGGLPKIKFVERGLDVNSSGKEYKLYVYPKDVSSNLTILCTLKENLVLDMMFPDTL
jgi:hypothetical protein